MVTLFSFFILVEWMSPSFLQLMVSYFRPQPTTTPTALSVFDKSDVTKNCSGGGGITVMALPVEMAGVPSEVSVVGDADAKNEVSAGGWTEWKYLSKATAPPTPLKRCGKLERIVNNRK